MYKTSFFAIFVAAILVLYGCSRTAPSQPEGEISHSQSQFVLATICTIILFDDGRPEVYREIFDRLREIENRMSAYLEGSYINRINSAAGIEAVQVPPDVFSVIERAVFTAEVSNGAFDPTVRPLVALWDIGGVNPRVPAREEIDSVLPLIDWRDVVLDRANRTVFLRRPGMALDLGAIAKGFAADEAAIIVKNHQIPLAIIDLGGNVLLVGTRTDRPWRIGVQDPSGGRGEFFGIVSTFEATSVVTSGIYERYLIEDGVHYHHLFDPFTGYPAANGLLSVTVITDVSKDADAFSLAAFVMGYQQGRALIESLEGKEAIFVFDDKTISLTSGLTLNVDFILTDESFRIVSE